MEDTPAMDLGHRNVVLKWCMLFADFGLFGSAGTPASRKIPNGKRKPSGYRHVAGALGYSLCAGPITVPSSAMPRFDDPLNIFTFSVFGLLCRHTVSTPITGGTHTIGA